MSKKETVEPEKSDKSDKSDKSVKTEKALFIQRFVAFIIDILLISMVASFIVVPFVDNDSITKLTDSGNEVSEKYLAGEIDEKAYFTESMNITYQMARKNGALTFVTLLLEILYFIVFQFYRGGQTIGKKLMKIKVVSTDGDMTINQMLFRALIIDMILLDMIVFGFVIFAPVNVYYYGTLVLEIIQYLIIFVSVVMICFNKSRRGLHDLIARTEVVKVS